MRVVVNLQSAVCEPSQVSFCLYQLEGRKGSLLSMSVLRESCVEVVLKRGWSCQCPVSVCLWDRCSVLLQARPSKGKVVAVAGLGPAFGQDDPA